MVPKLPGYNAGYAEKYFRVDYLEGHYDHAEFDKLILGMYMHSTFPAF